MKSFGDFGSPAEASGLRPGDVIVAIDDRVIAIAGTVHHQPFTPVHDVGHGSDHGQCLRARALLTASLSRIDPPPFATFFVLAGAELQPAALACMGAAGAVYVIARPVGKMLGVRMALRGSREPEAVRAHLGRCIISSSSLALGPSLQVRRLFPNVAEPVSRSPWPPPPPPFEIRLKSN